MIVSTHFRCMLVLTAPFLLATLAGGQNNAKSSQFESNKNLVREFYKHFPADPEAAAQLLADDYIEHAPRFVEYNQVNQTSGKQGFMQATKNILGGLGRGGGKGAPAVRVPELTLAEGDLVTFIWKRSVPDPKDQSKTYEGFSFDTYRIKNGKMAEHWDAGTK